MRRGWEVILETLGEGDVEGGLPPGTLFHIARAETGAGIVQHH